MTEKHYGGTSSFGFKNKFSENSNNLAKEVKTSERKQEMISNSKNEIEKLIQAGKIAKETIEFGKKIIKKDVPLLEIAEKIESKKIL